MGLKSHRTQIALSKQEATPLRIVADAAVATAQLGDGRLIPLVIVDTSARPDFEELVRVHEYLAPGDVASQWGEREATTGIITLILTFQRPSELVVILDFDIVSQGGLVDLILNSKGLYIQPGKDGDRFITTPDAPRILVEIPDTGFREDWDRMLHRHVMKDMKKRGMSRQQAKQAARQFIEEWRKFGQIRMKRS